MRNKKGIAMILKQQVSILPGRCPRQEVGVRVDGVWKDGWMGGWMDGWMGGRIDVLLDG